MQDEHDGKGGSYIVENGVRRLVERTKSADDPEQPKAAEDAAYQAVGSARVKKAKE